MNAPATIDARPFQLDYWTRKHCPIIRKYFGRDHDLLVVPTTVDHLAEQIVAEAICEYLDDYADRTRNRGFPTLADMAENASVRVREYVEQGWRDHSQSYWATYEDR